VPWLRRVVHQDDVTSAPATESFFVRRRSDPSCCAGAAPSNRQNLAQHFVSGAPGAIWVQRTIKLIFRFCHKRHPPCEAWRQASRRARVRPWGFPNS